MQSTETTGIKEYNSGIFPEVWENLPGGNYAYLGASPYPDKFPSID
jgi:hypothetical protein